jgi:hypothetical protein
MAHGSEYSPVPEINLWEVSEVYSHSSGMFLPHEFTCCKFLKHHYVKEITCLLAG